MTDLWQLLSQLSSVDTSALAEFSPVSIFLILFVTTFLTEDGACLLAGALAAVGTISFGTAVAACFAGIFVGDVGLYFVGRAFGSGISRSRILSRAFSGKTMERASHWLERRGLAAIFISRFVAGLRLPTYLAAGILKVSFPRFTIYFLIAAAVWTPLLVGSAFYLQENIFGTNFLLGAIALFASAKLVMIVARRSKRRIWVGRFKRIYRWEFWPVQIFYIPVVLYIFFLAIRHRSFTVFTCANPAIPAGGFIGESKDKIYRGLAASPGASRFLLRHLLIDAYAEAGAVEELMHAEGLEFPVAFKPDSGERGRDVRILRSTTDLLSALGVSDGPFILQEYADGKEFGVFYFRYPGKNEGEIFSITAKVMPEVKGDGDSTLEELILDDPRAVCIATTYLEELDDDPDRVPDEGEIVRLVEIGTHARGAVFVDGGGLKSEEIERVMNEICEGYEGFFFGRFDVKAPSSESFSSGRDLKIIELNGVTSESTNIYDPKFSLVDAYRILFEQWKIAFEVGRLNRSRGARQYSVRELASLYISAHMKQSPSAAS